MSHDVNDPFLLLSSYLLFWSLSTYDITRFIKSDREEIHTAAYRQFIDTQSGDGRPVSPELRDEGKLVKVPDDAGSIPRATDNNVVR